MKSFQCVPILLWMLITIIVVGYTENISPLWKTSIYFLFFGLFSSPTLSNLIIEKIVLKNLSMKYLKVVKLHLQAYQLF